MAQNEEAKRPFNHRDSPNSLTTKPHIETQIHEPRAYDKYLLRKYGNISMSVL